MAGTEMRDYYRILGIPASAGADEIKRAYWKLAREHHPDITGQADTDAFREITRAYEVLSDGERRRAYDALRANERTGVPRQDRWFADEIAIDFPSMQSLLDRMRQSFFGFENAPVRLSAEILLNAGEALRGVSVPLDVPVRRTCSVCGGRGEVWMERCGLCAGSGASVIEHRVEVVVPAGVRNGARFRFSVNPPYAPVTQVEVRVRVR